MSLHAATDNGHRPGRESVSNPLAAAERGWYVHPLDHPALSQCVGVGPGHDPGTCTERGKHPATAWSRWATTDPQVITAKFAGRTRNYGIACGPSGLVVIDADKPGEFERWAGDHGHTIPGTYTVRTAHGRHWYFQAPGVPIGNQDTMFAGYAINVRGAGGYVVGAGSTHETGTVYTAETDHDPAAMPQWLTSTLTVNGTVTPLVTVTGSAKPLVTVSGGPFELPEQITSTITGGPPSRDEVLYKYACSLQGRGVPKTEAIAAMQHVAFPRVEQPEGHPYPLAKALSKVEQAYQQFGDGYTPNGKAKPDAPRRRLELTTAVSIKPRRVRWLWDARVALGTLGLLAGREGLGKSTVGSWIVAQITRGALPGEHLGQPRHVLVCAAEDSWEYTIVPRLIAAGADLGLVSRVEMVSADNIHIGLSLPRDLGDVERAARDTAAAMLILDPLTSRVDLDLDTHKDGEVRQALEPLVALADQTRMGVLGVMHFNKSASTDPLQLVMASKAFTAVARAVHAVVRDPDDDTGARRLFGTPKNNLGREDLPSLAFTLGSCPVPTDDGDAWVGRIEWGEQVTDTIGEVLRRGAETDENRSASKEAAGWLTGYLTDNGGTADSADIKRDGNKAGHSVDALKRARRLLKYPYVDYGSPRRTRWEIPGAQLEQPPPIQSEQTSWGGSLTAPTAPTQQTRGVRENLLQPVGAVGAAVGDGGDLLQLAHPDCAECRRRWVYRAGPCPAHRPKEHT